MSLSSLKLEQMMFGGKRISLHLLTCLLMIGISTPANAQSHQVVKKPETDPMSQKTWWNDKKIHINGLTITPGGFVAMEGLWRSRNIMSDIGSNFAAIPTLNLPQAYMRELRFSARQSRLSALAEGEINPNTLISGYVEADFLGNGSGNSNESNSFDLRIRNFYTDIDWNQSGWHLLAGQNWSLVTTNNDGITPRNELIPPTIDAQYIPGFVWKRQAQLRLTKNFGKQIWAAVSVENPQTTFGGSPVCLPTPGGVGSVFDGIKNIFCIAPGTGTLPSVNNFSFNHVPDVVGKLAFQANIHGHKTHLDVFGLYRDFYDRVYTTTNVNTNKDTSGYGGGVGAFLEILPKVLDLQGNILIGRGIGSYAAGLLPDVTFASDGSLQPIQEIAFMAGATVHATSALDVYVFGGEERQKAAFFFSPLPANNFFGLGVPNANNSGCNIEGGICEGNTKVLWQMDIGAWDKLYEGVYGQLKAGLQYSYTKKILFPGTDVQKAGVPTGVFVGGNTDDHMVFFSIRYDPFSVVNSVSPVNGLLGK